MSAGPLALVVRSLRRLWGGFGIATIPIVLGVATIIVGLVSWTDYVYSPVFACHSPAVACVHRDEQSPNYQHAFHPIAIVFFRTVSAFFPSVWNINEGTFWTDVTAVLGLLTFYSSVAILAAKRFAETLRRLAGRFLYRDHVIVVGGTALTHRAAALWARRRKVLHIIGETDVPPPGATNWVKGALDGTIIERFALARAAHVCIDLGEDMATLALALELLPGSLARPPRAGAGAGAGDGDDWTIVVNDKTLADQFAQRLAALRAAGHRLPHIHYFSPQRAVVRDLLAEHPLFLDSPRGSHSPLHVVVVGFGSTGSHLVEAIFLTALVADRARPRVTVLSCKHEADRAAFLAGRPALADELDVEFLDLTALDDFEGAGSNAARRLRARDAAAPSTAVFLMSDSFNENVRLAVKVKYIQRKTGRLAGELFALESSNEPGSACRMSRAFAQTIDGFLAFGLKESRLEVQLCDPDRRDRLARGLHASYLQTTGQSGPTWSELGESHRRANCNAADHAPAKLHMLGFDVAHLPAGVIPGLREEDVRDIGAALRAATGSSPSLVDDIIRLEHERWSIERRLDGWTYGERKDAARQTHPFLVDWEQLCARHPDEMLKDRGQIEGLIDCLVKYGDPRFAPRRDPAVLAGAELDPRQGRGTDRLKPLSGAESSVLSSRVVS